MRMGLKFQVAWALLHLLAAIIAAALMWNETQKVGNAAKGRAAALGAACLMHTASWGYHERKAYRGDY